MSENGNALLPIAKNKYLRVSFDSLLSHPVSNPPGDSDGSTFKSHHQQSSQNGPAKLRTDDLTLLLKIA